MPGWVKVMTVVAAIVAVGAIAGTLLASSLLLKIAGTVTAVVSGVAGGLVWLYFSASDRTELPLHGHDRGKKS